MQLAIYKINLYAICIDVIVDNFFLTDYQVVTLEYCNKMITKKAQKLLYEM